ncbi:unnamed protein product [Notodromas monacha]|uniref:RWD domain-containing protein n=1 Tax=Notodromas monacha TaxID=399045 RepID=A0A7R9BWP3_9CRUS|nr:unnamed protein product [Notodromas monacha]CAG0923175.1 unnamed protein product [Notodromas monacha]
MSEAQAEEREVLDSIYEGDSRYKKLNETVFQYQCGEHGSQKSFIVQVRWVEDYPEVQPEISLDVFYNQHLVEVVKNGILEEATKVAVDNLGMAMTYTIFEALKDSVDKLTEEQPLYIPTAKPEVDLSELCLDESSGKVKKTNLTKAQKRKAFDRYGASGELPRGWNWVDIMEGGEKRIRLSFDFVMYELLHERFVEMDQLGDPCMYEEAVSAFFHQRKLKRDGNLDYVEYRYYIANLLHFDHLCPCTL